MATPITDANEPTGASPVHEWPHVVLVVTNGRIQQVLQHWLEVGNLTTVDPEITISYDK